MDRRDRTTQHVALPTAAALVYFEITKKQIDGSLEPYAREILCDVAHALSMLAPIYVVDGSSPMPRELPAADLIGATFQRGAHVLVTQNGTEHRNLTIQRRDMVAAVQLLRGSGFRRRWDGAG
jgi:hypothetical protein